MKPFLLENICCTRCGADLIYIEEQEIFSCAACKGSIPTRDGIPLFTQPLESLVPSMKLERGTDIGTPWRRANWIFLQEQLADLDSNSMILDVGAGRGDFAQALQGFDSLALDVYPYPEVDIVCDLTQVNPFKEHRFDAILLMNVLEHVYDTDKLVQVSCSLLKPGGLILVAIPFLVKIHQEPVDYVRYTHYALKQLGHSHGLKIRSLEGYYDPIFFLEEGIGNLKNAYLPVLNRIRRYPARILVTLIQLLSNTSKFILGSGRSLPPDSVRSKAPTGYQIVYQVPARDEYVDHPVP